MRSFLLLLLLVCQQYSSAGAQTDSTTLRYIISTQPAQYLFGDYNLKAERLFRRQSLGLLLGYKPATWSEGHVSDFPFLAYMDMNMFNKLYNAATLGLSTKFFPVKSQDVFVEGEVFYRHWWFDEKKCEFNLANAYRFNGIRTERQEVLGGKLLLGYTWMATSQNRVKWIVETFLGVSYRAKKYHFETRNGTVRDLHYDYLEEEGNWKPEESKSIGLIRVVMLQCGIRFGIGF